MTIRNDISANINTLKTLKVQNDNLFYKNKTFRRIGFWGKILKGLTFLFCGNLKPYDKKFIAERMVNFYLTNHSKIKENEKKVILINIKNYVTKKAQSKDLLIRINQFIQKTKKAALREDKGKSLDLDPILPVAIEGNSHEIDSDAPSSSTSTATRSSDKCEDLEPELPMEIDEIDDYHASSSGSVRDNIDWNELLQSFKKSKDEGMIVAIFEKGDFDNISKDQAVKLYTMIQSIPSLRDRVGTLHSYIRFSLRTELSEYLFRKIATGPLQTNTWNAVVKFISIPNDTLSNQELEKIVRKDTQDIASCEALKVAKILYEHDTALASQFMLKLNEHQIEDIIKHYMTSDQFLNLTQYVNKQAMVRFCQMNKDINYKSILFDAYDLDEKDITAIMPEQIDQLVKLLVNFYLNKEVLVILAKNMFQCATGKKDLVLDFSSDEKKYFDYNVKSLRELKENTKDKEQVDALLFLLKYLEKVV